MDNQEVVLFYLSIGGVVWYLVLLGVGLLGWWTAHRRYRIRPRSPLATASRASAPGVSILRPLKGLDTNLYENLESTFTQQYPNFEILLSVAEENDQALSVARDLITKYPAVDAKIIIGEEIVGVNPKVNNLMRSYRVAANDILWVIDSNIMVDPGTLARSVDALGSSPSTPNQRRVALVHHVPFACINEPRLGSRLEEAFLNTNHAKMYLALNTMAIDSCVVGKSNLYRRSDIERLNGSLKPISSRIDTLDETLGLPAFGKFLAEDNMIASALWHELGLRHDLSCDVVHNVVGNMSLADYFWRRVRWIRVRKHMVLAATVVEPFTESILLSVIASASIKHLFDSPIWMFLLVHFAFWIYIDLDVYASLAGFPLPSNRRWSFLGAWVVRELLAFPIWVFAITGSEVDWRGQKYEVMRNGEVRKSNDKKWFNRLAWFQVWKRPHHYEPLDLEPVQ